MKPPPSQFATQSRESLLEAVRKKHQRRRLLKATTALTLLGAVGLFFLQQGPPTTTPTNTSPLATTPPTSPAPPTVILTIFKSNSTPPLEISPIDQSTLESLLANHSYTILHNHNGQQELSILH